MIKTDIRLHVHCAVHRNSDVGVGLMLLITTFFFCYWSSSLVVGLIITTKFNNAFVYCWKSNKANHMIFIC